ncbi:hypothetical protein, partial [Streptomyces sp. NPDC058398]|uniref:hypothetical protein n=1 Tax=Streptomyces sp. NPDC058398 TaxID=3346479 RepID=UPI003647F4C7
SKSSPIDPSCMSEKGVEPLVEHPELALPAVATTGNPALTTARALPASQAFGSTGGAPGMCGA